MDFEPNFAAFRQMAVGAELRAAVTAEAEKRKAIAEGLAADFRVSGEYQDSFETRTEIVRVAGADRVAGILENTSDHAAAVEWGNARDHRAHHVLARALDAGG